MSRYTFLRAYTKLNKSDREKEILYDLPYIWKSKKKKLLQENRLVVIRSGGDIDEGGQKVLIQIFISKVNTSRDIMYSIVSTENNTVLFGSCQ